MSQSNESTELQEELTEELQNVAESEAAAAEVVEDLSAILTADLQRLQAEYAIIESE